MAVFDFKKLEEKVLKFWDEHKIFEKSLSQRAGKGKKKFVFFEGPPTANGHPGMHHFIGRAYKDVFNRYKAMRGFYVLRKAGWDTHGLPVELQVEKELGFKSKKDIEAFGIAQYNRQCRQSVWRFKSEWEDFTRKMGFWVDLKHPYVTYENYYMESIWSILKTIWDKQLLYQAHKVVPFCTRCGTPLSSHEVAQGYKKVTERSVYLKFKIKNEKLKISSGDPITYNLKPNTYILAWTTTPWTLPGNVALAVGKDIDYAIVENNNEQLILAKDLVGKVFDSETKIGAELKGSDLVGLEYEPLFDIKALRSKTAYKIYEAPFVSTVDGTGVVHTAVMYGEDDYNLGTAVGLPKIHTVDEQGKFIGVSKELDGKYVKSKEVQDIIVSLLEKNSNLLKSEDYEHDYPFCWRCDTPLIYYAKTSWFIRMSAVNEKLLKNNKSVNWIPEHIKEGRFGQWLGEGKDWAISRERYWGTPLPIWKCVKCDNVKTVGSVAELKANATGSGNTYYMLRHGLTDRHERQEMILGSRLESDKYNLTEEGRKMIQSSVEKFKIKEEKIDVILASPFLRTRQTAEIVGKLYHCEVQVEERLREIVESMVCEGMPRDKCPYAGTRVTMDAKPGDGECWNDVRLRLAELMSELESKYRGKKILIVSHGDPLWLLEKIAKGLDEKEILARKDDWYPEFGEVHALNYLAMPRNEYGELDLHRPFVDNVVFRCELCSADLRRIPEIIDVWFDSGAMPYAQWHWPFENDKTFREQYPADFICEGIDQTRGWFYTLLAIATLIDKGAPYKNVLSYSHVLDEKGQKMSKSKGNIVSPADVMEKFGADTARWYFYTINAPGDYKMFSEKDVRERLTGFMSTLQNCLNFYELYKEPSIDYNLSTITSKPLLDKWVLSRLHSVTDETTEALDKYDFVSSARAIEKFVVEDFSNWWLRRSRKRKDSLPMLRMILLEISKLCAPFIPFTAEDMHMRLHAGSTAGTESVHLHNWPKANKKMVNAKLEEEMQKIREAIAQGLAIRKEKQIKVRQPLRSATVIAGKKFHKDLEKLLLEELNVKEIKYAKTGELVLDLILSEELKFEGYAREIIRQIQDMRKDANYRFDQLIYCQWFTNDAELSAALYQWADAIKHETYLSEFIKLQHDDRVYDVEKEFNIAPTKTIWLGVKN